MYEMGLRTTHIVSCLELLAARKSHRRGLESVTSLEGLYINYAMEGRGGGKLWVLFYTILFRVD